MKAVCIGAFLCRSSGSGSDHPPRRRKAGVQFLLWQGAYAEFLFTDTLWPDFRKKIWMQHWWNISAVIADMEEFDGKRILTAVIWLPIAALGFAFAPVWAIALAISALSVVAVYELLWATGLVRQKRLCVISAVFAALVPLWTYYSSEFYLLLLGAFLLVSLCFLDGMLHQAKVKFEMVCAALFGALIVPCFYPLSCAWKWRWKHV